MKPVFEYLDYRVFLRDFFEEKKSRHAFFSYRMFGKRVGLDGSYLAKVLAGTRHIADDVIRKVAEVCGLREPEAEYFEALVHYSKAKTDKAKQLHFERMLAIRSTSAQRLQSNQFEYYRHWHHSAVRSILEYYDFRGDFAELGATLSPPISAQDAEESIGLLMELGLVDRDEDGRYRMTSTSITTGPQWQSMAIEAFQEETIRLSQESIKRHPKGHRDVSTVTMNISAQDYAELRKRILEFRRTLINYVNSSAGSDRTYQLNIQLFPLSRIGRA